MRLKKTDWMLLAIVAGSVMGFGSWLQGEMNRASLVRIQRDSANPQDAQDTVGACAGMSTQDTRMMGKGELWCGTIGAPAAIVAPSRGS